MYDKNGLQIMEILFAAFCHLVRAVIPVSFRTRRYYLY